MIQVVVLNSNPPAISQFSCGFPFSHYSYLGLLLGTKLIAPLAGPTKNCKGPCTAGNHKFFCLDLASLLFRGPAPLCK